MNEGYYFSELYKNNSTVNRLAFNRAARAAFIQRGVLLSTMHIITTKRVAAPPYGCTQMVATGMRKRAAYSHTRRTLSAFVRKLFNCFNAVRVCGTSARTLRTL